MKISEMCLKNNFQETRDFSRFWLGKARKETKGSKSFIFSRFGGFFAVFLVCLAFPAKISKNYVCPDFFKDCLHMFLHFAFFPGTFQIKKNQK